MLQLADMVCGSVVCWHQGEEGYLDLIQNVEGTVIDLYEKKKRASPKASPDIGVRKVRGCLTFSTLRPMVVPVSDFTAAGAIADKIANSLPSWSAKSNKTSRRKWAQCRFRKWPSSAGPMSANRRCSTGWPAGASPSSTPRPASRAIGSSTPVKAGDRYFELIDTGGIGIVDVR